MAINFPTSLDVFTDPTASDQLNLPSHSGQHTDLNNAVEALEAKVGINSSAVTSSHDYKIAQLEAQGTWTAFTPTWTNVTVGNATQDFVYAMVGDIVFIEGTFQLGSTSAVTGSIQMDLPSGYEFATNHQIYIGPVRCVNAGVEAIFGHMRSPGSGSSTMELKVFSASATFTKEATGNATNPFSWGTGDQMEMSLAARVTAV